MVNSKVVKISSKSDEFNFLVELLGTDGFDFMPDCGEPARSGSETFSFVTRTGRSLGWKTKPGVQFF